MKKIIWILLGIICITLIGGVGFYFWGLTPKSESTEPIIFKIEPGTSKTMVAKKLQKMGLIKNEFALDLYLFLHSMNIQAGEYELNPSMKPEEMLEKFKKGDILIHSATITLIEGKRITEYAKTLSESLAFTEEEFLATANDTEFLTSLVDEYWFLTDQILNKSIYYPLEGYLYPDTYEFLQTTTPKEVIKTILTHTEKKLESLKEKITTNSHTVHDLFTMASIVEKEANTESDRATAAQVFYTRLKDNWSLGSDVTAFYGAKKEMGKDSETWDVLNGVNPYNTRLTDGTMNGKLPIGPICSPSLSSIEAALTPSNTNYYFFVANTCTGEVFFQTTAAEFNAKTKELSDNGCM